MVGLPEILLVVVPLVIFGGIYLAIRVIRRAARG